jgi:hypothetical protein
VKTSAEQYINAHFAVTTAALADAPPRRRRYLACFLAFALGTSALGKPMTEGFVKWLRPQWVHDHITQAGRTAHDAQTYHRTHMRLTTSIAAAQTLHLAAACVVNLRLPGDVAQGLLSLLALATHLAVLLITLGRASRFLRRRNSTIPGYGRNAPVGAVASMAKSGEPLSAPPKWTLHSGESPRSPARARSQ